MLFFRQKLRLQVSQLKRGSHLRRTFLAKALLILSGNNTQMLWPTPSGVKTSALATKVWCCIGDWRDESINVVVFAFHVLPFRYESTIKKQFPGSPYFEIKLSNVIILYNLLLVIG
jgi:hypothetical protein